MCIQLSGKRILILFFFFTLVLPSCNLNNQENNTIHLAYLQSDLHHLPAFVALEKGFFTQEGLSVEVSGIFKAGPELMSGFAAGSLDVGYVGLSPATVAVANKTAQVKVIAQVNKNGSAIVVGKNAPCKSLNDLKRKIIAIPGHSTIQDFLLRKALSNAGVSDTTITIITIKPPEMIGVLASNQIDAFIAWEPYPSMAITKNAGKILINSSDIWQNHPCCVLVVSTQFMQGNPSKINSLLKAHLKSINYIKDNVMEAITIGMKYTGMDKKTVERALQNIQYDYRITTSQAIEYIEFLNNLGYTSIVNPHTFIQSLIITNE